MNEQLRFDGPGVYAIVPYQKPNTIANSWGGTTNPDEAVNVHDIGSRGYNFTDNEWWQFALVHTDGQEYVILNVRNGYYLSVGGGKVSCARESPLSGNVRFTIRDASQTSNGYHVFHIDGATDGQIHIPNGYHQGSAFAFGRTNDAETSKFYIVKRRPS